MRRRGSLTFRVDKAALAGWRASAQARHIDVILVTELSRWGRSTLDLLETLRELEARRVSVIALSGMTFDLASAAGRMMAPTRQPVVQAQQDDARPSGGRPIAPPLRFAPGAARHQGAQHRQAPDAAGERDLDQQHGGHPAQPATGDRLLCRGPDGIVAMAGGTDVGAAAPFEGMIDPDDDRPMRDEGLDQGVQQSEGQPQP
ncbi:hypothetical protein D3867_35785 (plasmid) [Azospirillum argentinense]|uniref:Resolvase/invertase-type recombinase catalytic domain-containing protein n=1 Tax=Azospirillum brasilense TaxID=192 RepID=A0A4D8QEG8_AZOBR|nr:hypothetical protein D3867_35785 [Azospirillum argentinense]